MKILKTIGVILLLLLPFLGGVAIAGHSPYIAGNSPAKFLLLCGVHILLSVFLMIYLSNLQKDRSLLWSGRFFFLAGSTFVVVAGLGAPPDTSLEMLKHPEREHYRYAFLLLCTFLFIAGAFATLSYYWAKSPKWNRFLLIPLLLGFGELVWQLAYHYQYPEALANWINNGNKPEDFIKNYDTLNIILNAAASKFLQYCSVAWIAIILAKTRKIQWWLCIIICMFCLFGLLSASVILYTRFNLPPSLGILMIFFIPAIPLVLAYWIGVGILTKSK